MSLVRQPSQNDPAVVHLCEEEGQVVEAELRVIPNEKKTTTVQL